MNDVIEKKDTPKETLDDIQKMDLKEVELPKLPEGGDLKKLPDSPFQIDTSIYDDIFRQKGLVAESSETSDGDTKQDAGEDENDYSDYLEKGDDGKYYDKETGKAYDSVEDWVKAQETLAKRYEGTAKYYEEKAKREWARFKNSESNGESEAEKWEHYRKSQEYYAKAKECRDKAKAIREKLGKKDTNESSSLKQDEVEAPISASFEAIPFERREGVISRFNEAPDGIKKIVDNLESVLQVEDSEIYENEDGTFSYGASCYSPSENKIFMNPEYDNEEYTEVFSHEYGHFVDTQLGDISTEFDFVFALDADIDKVLSNDMKEQMLDDLTSSDAFYDRSVSDILSGAFLNDDDIVMRYFDEGVPYYRHTNDYWEYGPANACEKETFANLFRIYSDSGRSDSKEFVEKYFPNTCEQFKASLSI